MERNSNCFLELILILGGKLYQSWLPVYNDLHCNSSITPLYKEIPVN